MYIFDKPPLPPNVCMKCRCSEMSPGREWFIDMVIDTEYDGRVYFCNLCVKEICRIAPEMYTFDQVNEIVIGNQAIVTKANELIELYEGRIAVLEEMGFDLTKAVSYIEKVDANGLRGITRSDDSEPDSTESKLVDSIESSTGSESESTISDSSVNPLFPISIDLGIS